MGPEGDAFSSLQSALNFLEDHPDEKRHILVRPGRYVEQVEVRIPGVIITGESRAAAKETVITLELGAKEMLKDGKKRGTFRTYTLFVNAPDVTLSCLTIENSAGPGKLAGQAMALYADGNRLIVDSCYLLGWQDTLFTAPLPPKEIERDGFVGPKQFAPRIPRKQYYKDCHIEGDVDFVFGGATAYFEHCTFFSRGGGRDGSGYVTAPSTPQGQCFGYVMDHCLFAGDCPDQTVFLGRPWREWGRTVLLFCRIGPHIRKEGWDDWGKELAHETSFFVEYQCTGPGSALSHRPDWVHRLTPEEAAGYTKKRVLGEEKGQEPPWWQRDLK